MTVCYDDCFEDIKFHRCSMANGYLCTPSQHDSGHIKMVSEGASNVHYDCNGEYDEPFSYIEKVIDGKADDDSQYENGE